jgi:EmrB/QacA subfamily drug resistance transporter
MEIQKNPIRFHDGKWGATLAIGLGVFMGALDMSIINISLPTLLEELNTRFATIQWVFIGYNLVLTSAMLGAARMGDMYGKNRLYNWGLFFFTLSSLLCGFSPDVGWLIAFRILQGFGAVMMYALGNAIIVEIFPPQERGRALGIVGSVASIGISLGPAVGGLIIGMVGWRWIFLVKVPLGIIALFAALKFLPMIPPRQANQRFDVIGALVIFITLGCFALGMTFAQDRGLGNRLVLALLLFSAAGAISFLKIEKKVTDPMVDLTLFQNIPFSLNLMMGLFSFITLGGVFIIPFFLQLVKHYTPQQIGLIMMVTPVSVALFSLVSGLLSDRFGTRGLSMAGLFIMASGCLSISTLNVEVGVVGYLIRMAPLGLGLGIFQSPNNSAIMGEAPPERLGVASGLLSLTRSLGQTTGMPIMGAIFTASLMASANMTIFSSITDAPPHALVSGLTATYRIGGIFILVFTMLSMLALWMNKRHRAAGCKG